MPRDLDVALYTAINAGRHQGAFVRLTGGSSVGKTRALFEAITAVVPDWWLLHPADAAAIGDFAVAPTKHTVVWLDELQKYLDHPSGLPAATVRSPVSAGVVVVATLWPGEYSSSYAHRHTPGQCPCTGSVFRAGSGLQPLPLGWPGRPVAGELRTVEKR